MPGPVINANDAAQRALVQKFRESLAALRLNEAFDAGEELLNLRPYAESYEALMLPVDRHGTRLTSDTLYALLDELDSNPAATHLPWRRYLRFVILDRLDWLEDAFLASAEFAALPDRYGWMRFYRGLLLVTRRWAFADARKEFEAALRAAPTFWKAAAHMAECLLCQGREAQAFAIMDECVARLTNAGVPMDREVAAIWRGELHLWMGRYVEARKDFEAPADRGVNLALGWRGASRLLSGDAEGALADLNRAVELEALDGEALVWRGEAKLQLGRIEDAIGDFDRGVTLTGAPVWPLIDRALARARLGDERGFWSDYDLLPARLTQMTQRRLKLAVDRDVKRGAAVLESMRSAARGIRRSESYLLPLWIGRTVLPT